jgi:formate hydrogenlyase subunit 6/NADH:ubiquinone oxidoreductase subunit I/coenzyme F420-reducing hydrogenase delta subunit
MDVANSSLCFTKVVNILNEISSGFSDAEISDRIKLLLTSQISKAFSCSDISQDNLKLCFSLSQSEITRRNLASSLLPRYEVIPAISSDDCLGSSCALCANSCPAGAILDSEGGSKIDKSSCTGCGACVNACPRGAISYPGYSTVELEREIESLLSNHDGLPYRILAINCQSCSKAGDPGIENCSPYIFNIEAPSPAIISPLLLLNAFNMGTDGIVFLHDEEGCPSKMPQQSLYNTIHFVQKLLDRWEIDRNRVGYINKVDSNDSELNGELHRFADKIISLGHTPFKSAAGSMTFEGMYSLAAIIKEMDAKLQLPEEGVLSGEDVPFGIVNIDQTLCSGCGVCVQICPAGALSTQMSGDPSTLKLTFNHAKCIACGLCANICPEKCIKISKTLDFARLSNLEETILENEFMRCRNCSKPYATKSMIDILKHKLKNAGTLSTEWAEYCPSCRVVIQQKR